jgi:hypothetical protein
MLLNPEKVKFVVSVSVQDKTKFIQCGAASPYILSTIQRAPEGISRGKTDFQSVFPLEIPLRSTWSGSIEDISTLLRIDKYA